jgi:hexosaminidase
MTQTQLDEFAQHLQVRYRVITNEPSEQCLPKESDGQCVTLALSLTSPIAFHHKQWQVYFSHINPIQSDDSDDFEITHLNGDLHRLVPTKQFKGFEANDTYTIRFRANYWSLSEYDALPNYIITAPTLIARVIQSTQPVVDDDTHLEILPFVESFTDEKRQFKRGENDHTQWLTANLLYERNVTVNELAQTQSIDSSIIPTPKYQQLTGGRLNLEQGFNLKLQGVDLAALSPAIARLEKLGIKFSTSGKPLIVQQIVGNGRSGSYRLNIKADSIYIMAADDAGAFYALQSIASLLRLGETTLPTMKVVDEPHYDFRGMHIDVARNFHSKAFIYQLIEQMSAYKLNKLHLHLADDEGWRIEIPELPELTEIGAQRCFDLTEQHCLLPQLGAGINTPDVNGYYSVQDYQDILQYAKKHYVEVIPSMDMPGHSRAAIIAMNARYKRYIALGEEEKAKEFWLTEPEDTTEYRSVQYYNDNTLNVCLPSTYHFIDTVINSLQRIHQQAGVPLIRYHIGADETAGAWKQSPACQQFLANNTEQVNSVGQLVPYFVERVANLLDKKGIEAAAWNDGLMHTRSERMPKVVQANAWSVLAWQGHKAAHELANRGMSVVLSQPDVLYFDFPYEADPKEPGYYWASRQVNTEKIFQFMPNNLPVHAEFWRDREQNRYQADDRVDSKSGYKPLSSDVTFSGIQGHLWSESTRNDTMAAYKIYPRLFALAERAWHKALWSVPYNVKGDLFGENSHYFTQPLQQTQQIQWAQFAKTLALKTLPKLDHLNVVYRLPTIGAKIVNNKLYANSSFPGISIQYFKNGQWVDYIHPVNNAQLITAVRAINTTGNRAGRALVIQAIDESPKHH